ncbi:MAG: 3'(2'),5'-bisphosphate nucleotidase CysQ [Nitrospirae bacterium]|nr:3'(2'),5'-bisphosphate nucleotidase CysQ [Nitrospirota bacterium]
MTEEQLLLLAVIAARSAGEAILEVYESDFAVEHKDDKSPLTLADRRAHDVITGHLAEIPPPVLSEEGRDIPYDERKNWDVFWLVDPLDGTKEFVKRNGEFTVNIALVRGGRPVLGVIYVPVTRRMYFASEGLGAFLITDETSIPADTPGGADSGARFKALCLKASRLPLLRSDRPFTVVGSRSHPSEEFVEFTAKVRGDRGDLEIIPAGSSLKFCLIAEGKADLYPRFGPTMEWDTAAGQAVVECSGGRVLDKDTLLPLAYNKQSLRNPFFIAERGGFSVRGSR